MLRKLLYLLPMALLFTAMRAGGPQAQLLWETPRDLKTPESVLYLEGSKTLLVANINGKSGEKDGNGFLAELDMKGQPVKTWPAELSAPKGMGVWEDHVYVTDIDRLVKVDMKTGKIAQSWTVEGSVFLNDVAVHPHGIVFFTDMKTGKIHQLKEGQVSLFAEGLNRPNGLYVEDDNLLVGENGAIKRSSITSANWELVTNNTSGGVDGLEGDGEGGYFFSDWRGAVRHVNAKGKVSVLFDNSAEKVNAADIEYVAASKMLLVPTFYDNRVVAYTVQ